MTYLFFCFFIMICSCQRSIADSYQPLTDDEWAVIQMAIIDADNEKIIAALELLDKRIANYHDKTDYRLKIQILLTAQQFSDAVLVINATIKRYPDFLEMATLRCVLALYLNDPLAHQYYANVLTGYERRLSSITNDGDKYVYLVTLFLLSHLFSDTQQQDLYLTKIQDLSIQQENIPLSDYLNLANAEIFSIFGISSL